MTNSLNKKAPHYPKTHIAAGCGVALLLLFVWLAVPSKKAESQRTALPLVSEVSASKNDATSTETPTSAPAADANNNAATATNDAQPVTLATAKRDETATTTSTNDDAENSDDTEEISSPKPHTGPRELSLTVQIGDNLDDIFEQAGLDDEELNRFLANKDAKKLARLKPGQTFEVKVNAAGDLERLVTRTDDLVEIQVKRSGDGFNVTQEKIAPAQRQAYARGVIESSFSAAARRAGLPHSMVVELSNIFAYDIDFALDIRKGDEFEVIYEENVIDGRRVGTGQILAARFTNQGKVHSALRYAPAKGSASYYSADGKSLRKAFIRTPIDVVRISSRFSQSRKHPVLNTTRAHKGVDYAAPVGTPIRAAGDGKVVAAERQGGYGNVIMIQHSQKYTTVYGHMKGFAKGIKNGSSVKQGQIIGYVGMTGLTSGPHLHYEFRVAGNHVDPLKQKQMMTDPLAGADRQRFLQGTRSLVARMDRERSTLLAMNQRQQQQP